MITLYISDGNSTTFEQSTVALPSTIQRHNNSQTAEECNDDAGDYTEEPSQSYFDEEVTGVPRRSKRSLRGSSLLHDPSGDEYHRTGHSWADLDTSQFLPRDNDIGIRASPPMDIRIGPSMISGAELGLFIQTGNRELGPGIIIGEYWAADTRNQGIPSIYVPRGVPVPTGSRANDACLLRHWDHLVDADEDCSMGYAKEGWGDANCFFPIFDG